MAIPEKIVQERQPRLHSDQGHDEEGFISGVKE
jgi:hypothetical protein